MATHSSVLAWRIPGTGKPGGLPSMGPHRVGHDWNDLAAELSLESSLLKLESLLLSPYVTSGKLLHLFASLALSWKMRGKIKQMHISPQFNKSTSHLPKLKNEKAILWLLKLSPLQSNRMSHADQQKCCHTIFLQNSGFKKKTKNKKRSMFKRDLLTLW